MKKLHKQIWIAIAIVACIVLVGAFGIGKGWYRLQRAVEHAQLPSAAPYQSVAVSTSPRASISSTPAPTEKPLPKEANLAVPFTAQAPHANWEDPYGEFCEEASVLMAISYVRNEKIPDANFADKALNGIKVFEEKTFGYYKDTTIAETASIFRNYYKYDKVEVLPNPTITDIKKAIAAGRLVIVPAAGRSLGNPFFQVPGPLYHMFVIKGYTATGKFIVNDPGTRRGADFLYDQQTVMDAMHDWREDRNIDAGEKVILIVG